MAKLRLLQHHRNLLREAAAKHIYPKMLSDANDAAYKKAAPLVKAAVEEKWPTKDMEVLVKYGHTVVDNGMRVLFPNGVITMFTFRCGKRYWNDETSEYAWRDAAFGIEPPRVPDKRQNEIYALDQKTADAVDAWQTARDAYEKEYTKRRGAYDALIQGANYLEDLLDVWPEAAQLVPKTSGAIVAMGPEQVAAIKADLEEQRKRKS